MSPYGEMIWNFSCENKIMPYEDELIERLRDKYYEGIPLSISLNSKVCCNRCCHYMAFQLTRGMDNFKLVRGNINRYPIEKDGNHSWVEKDGWVYDTTDGFRWDKDIYYEVFDATLVSEYDETSCMDFWFYRKELLERTGKLPKWQTAMIIEVIELLEMEKPHINHAKLMEEIKLYRKKENMIEKEPDEVMINLKKIVSEELEKRNNL